MNLISKMPSRRIARLSCFSYKSLYFIIAVLCVSCSRSSPPADLVFFNGRVVTVDSAFTVAGAVAVRGERIEAVGTDKEILALAGPETRKIDLAGRSVLPGLIEAHAHPERASLSELERPLSNPRTVKECLDWISEMVRLKASAEWIVHPKLFATRLAEMRPPTLAELDSVAPDNPVFLNGSYGGSVNSAALRASGISGKTDHPGLLRDPDNGRLNGKLNFTALPLLKLPDTPRRPLPERAEALEKMFARYNRSGFTSFTSGAASLADTVLYNYLRQNGRLSIRTFLNIFIPVDYKGREAAEVRRDIEALGIRTGDGDEWVRIGALKTTIDGGILTGTAYLHEPWGPGAREIFGVADPAYRGIVRLTVADFEMFARAGAGAGWKLTAHCTGGAGVDLMLEGYERVNREAPIVPLRCSIIHGNFFTPEAMARAGRLGVIADLQPAWFYKDGDAMLKILGPERMKTFHPNRSLIDAGVVISAGSDHMVITDDIESINPYNPWIAIWSMVTRRTEIGSLIDPEQAITRGEALRCYTINNAFASFEEHLKGSIETGKLADLVVTDKDYLSCSDDELKNMKVALTVVGGKVVYEAR